MHAARRLAPLSSEPLLDRQIGVRLVRGRDHYELLINRMIRSAKVSLWIATANVKDVHVEAAVGTRARARGRYSSIVEMFGQLTRRGVEIRLLHGATPSRPFRASLSRHPLPENFEMRCCPRLHMKMVAVDGAMLYLGSANLTGAGLGAKADGRRNFEAGILSDDDVLLDDMQAEFQAIWSGARCDGCKLRRQCPKPLDIR